MPYDHAEPDVAISNLLQGTGANRASIRRLDPAGVVVRLVDVKELGERASGHHAIEIRNELLGTALLGDVEGIARVIAVKSRFATRVAAAQNRQNGQREEIALSQALGG